MAKALAVTPYALGMTGMTVVEQSAGKVKALNLNGIAPAEDDVRSGRYFLARDFLFVIKGEPTGPVNRFLDLVMSSCMAYPYFVMWFGGRQSYRRHARRFAAQCPILFIHGRRKPSRFHSEARADELLTRKGNQVLEFDTGHWVMSEQPERFNQVVSSWVSQ